jgi:PhzF family phenazine biosynthesis protein
MVSKRRPRAFRQVDVFTEVPYLGNPLAVVLDGSGLSGDEMQHFANWTNLSETTFFLPPTEPEADYRVRIFTPTQELPFAGHPTLGSCHVWLQTGGNPRRGDRIVQQCAAGLIELRRTEHGLAFAAPPLVRSGPVDEATMGRLAQVLGIERREIQDAEWVDNGPGWVGVLLESADAVLALRPSFSELFIGVAGRLPDGGPATWEVRAFFPKSGSTVEDPVTGSFNASLAQWLLRSGRATAPWVARQGTALGRAGLVYLDQDETGTVWVGGGTVTCVSGEVVL